MADTKISAMTAATTPLAGTELVPLVQSGGNVQTSVDNLTSGRVVSAGNLVVTAATVPANGMYLSAANTLGWATASTLRATLTGYTFKVGTGTSVAIVNLDGNTGANVGSYLQLSRAGAATCYIGNDAAVNGGGSTSSDIVIFPIANVALKLYSSATLRVTLGTTGLFNISGGSFGLGAPVTKTGDFTLAATENSIISDRAATNTVTLPAASSWTGRIVRFKTVQAQTLVSASSNVVPLAGGAAGTAILAATAGKWADIQSDGTNWVIMAGN